jgi:hypothetical protein
MKTSTRIIDYHLKCCIVRRNLKITINSRRKKSILDLIPVCRAGDDPSQTK